MEGFYAISDPFHMRTWKRTGNEGTLGKRGRKDTFEKRVKLGGAKDGKKNERPLENPQEQEGAYNPRGYILCGKEHTETNGSIESVGNRTVFC